MRINVENDEMLGRAIENKLYLELYNRLKEKDKEIERLKGNIEILSDDLGNIGYMLGLEEGSCYEDVLEEIRKLQQKENIIKELDKQNRELGAELSLTTDKYEKKLFIKENIIKEVREYIKKNIDNEVVHNWYLTNEEAHELLEILDKVD